MRIAVVSDIHSNLPALDAVLADAGALDAVWHLGDVVGYGPDPDGVVGRLAELGAIGVLGNHDAAALGSDAQATVLHRSASTPALFQPGLGQAGASARRSGCACRVRINTAP